VLSVVTVTFPSGQAAGREASRREAVQLRGVRLQPAHVVLDVAPELLADADEIVAQRPHALARGLVPVHARAPEVPQSLLHSQRVAGSAPSRSSPPGRRTAAVEGQLGRQRVHLLLQRLGRVPRRGVGWTLRVRLARAEASVRAAKAPSKASRAASGRAAREGEQPRHAGASSIEVGPTLSRSGSGPPETARAASRASWPAVAGRMRAPLHDLRLRLPHHEVGHARLAGRPS